MSSLSHIDNYGNAQMVDVSGKPDSDRVAVARGIVRLSPDTIQLIRADFVPKGDVLSTARLAGIMGAKRTSELIPLCHPLPLTQASVRLEVLDDRIEVEATTSTTGKTGVEMEALTAVAVTALTIYDMVKAVDRAAVITDIRLTFKSGGKSGEYNREHDAGERAGL